MKASIFALSALLFAGFCSASEPTGNSFVSSSIKVDANGNIKSADTFEAAVAGGTLISTKASFANWGDGSANYDTIKLDGQSSLVLKDGTEMRFKGGTLDKKNSTILLGEGEPLSITSLTGTKVRDPIEYSCYRNHLLANGEDTGFSSVCLTNNTRIYCVNGRLGVQTDSFFCQVP